MKTNDLKKGVRVRLANGWLADVADNMKGNTRMCKVYGFEIEIGSVYSHDIVEYEDASGHWQPVEHTPAQLELKNEVDKLFV